MDEDKQTEKTERVTVSLEEQTPSVSSAYFQGMNEGYRQAFGDLSRMAIPLIIAGIGAYFLFHKGEN